MVLKLKPKPSPSNKPPPPAETPDPALFTKHVDFPGKRVWVSYPQPDRIVITGYLLAEHFKENFVDKAPLVEKVHELAKGLHSAQAFVTGKDGVFEGKGNLLARVLAPFGPRGARVLVEVRKVVVDGTQAFKMRIEFNPRKLGKAGCKQLQHEITWAAAGTFHFGQFLKDGRVNRLDVAVDYTDVRPADLIVTTKKKEGQRVHYLGTDGALETVQVHRPTKKAGLGSLAVKVYDRNRERKAHGKDGPYPGRRVTRLEIVKKRFPKGFSVADLLTIQNPLADVKLSYAPVLATEGTAKMWPAYLAARRGEGHEAAVKSLRIQPIIGSYAQKRYDGHPSNLLSADIWESWCVGLSLTGLSAWVEAASAV